MMTEWRVGDWIEDRYEVFDIHHGGMGVVYVVYDHQAQAGQRVLALKTLKKEFLRSSRPVARFVSECRTWIRLDRHPNIVHAYAVQLIDSQPYVSLELVTGGSLRSWIGTDRLDLPQALRFAVQFCLAMEHAVRKGLHCHRDIKPENLLVTEGGTLKVTDFGLAKIAEEAALYGGDSDPIPLTDGQAGQRIIPAGTAGWSEWSAGARTAGTDTSESGPDPATAEQPRVDLTAPAGPASPADSDPNGATIDWKPAPKADAGLAGAVLPLETEARHEPAPSRREGTRDGTVLGTGMYMSPEQFRHPRGVNLLADQYSFGVVLYEMIAGHPPFHARTAMGLARHHATGTPPSLVRFIPAKYSRVARRVDRIVQRCLEKDSAQRFASFAELRIALATLLRRLTGEVLAEPGEVELAAWDLNSKGVSLGILGHYEEERQIYEESIRIKPDFVPAWFNQAAAAGCQGYLDEVIDYAELALHLNPRSIPAIINKGLALHALKRPADAIACFNAALHLAPRDPDVWRGRVVVLLGLKNSEGARVALEQVRRLRPGEADPMTTTRLAPGPTKSRTAVLPWVRRTEDTTAAERVG